MASRDDNDTEATLDDVVSRLDVLITMLMPPPAQFVGRATGLQVKILERCDYEHTSAEIGKALGKTKGHIHKELSVLRSKGLVRSANRGDRQVHVRVDPGGGDGE